MKTFFNIAFTKRIFLNAIIISIAVGTIMNLINHDSKLFSYGAISWLHLSLNYVVPYCVATYSAVKNELSRSAAKQ